MLNRKLLTAAVLLSSGTFIQSRGQFQPGDVLTQSPVSWGEESEPGGMALLANYDSVYASTFGEVEIGIPGAGGFSIIFTNVFAVTDYQPSTGTPASLNADLVDPLSSASGVFGGEVLGLRFNIDFSDAGHTLGSLDIPFGDLVIRSYAAIPQVNGLTVRQVMAQANTLLAAGSVGYGVPEAEQLVFGLNNSFDNGQP